MIRFRDLDIGLRGRSEPADRASRVGILGRIGAWLDRHCLPPRSLLIAFLIGLGVAIVGPYKTHVLPLGMRVLYWCGVILTAHVTWGLTFYLVSRRRAFGRWPLLVRLLMANVVVAGSGSIMTVVIRKAMGQPLPGAFLESVLMVFMPFFAIASLVVMPIIAVVIHRYGSKAPEPDPEAEADGNPLAFMERLPETLRGDLLYLKAEDHYLRVFTERGNGLILMRLKDAVTELGERAGLQTHRSYWVARRAVMRIERAKRDLKLVIWNGDEVPVSRGFRDDAVEAFGPPRK